MPPPGLRARGRFLHGAGGDAASSPNTSQRVCLYGGHSFGLGGDGALLGTARTRVEVGP